MAQRNIQALKNSQNRKSLRAEFFHSTWGLIILPIRNPDSRRSKPFSAALARLPAGVHFLFTLQQGPRKAAVLGFPCKSPKEGDIHAFVEIDASKVHLVPELRFGFGIGGLKGNLCRRFSGFLYGSQGYVQGFEWV